MSNNIKLLILFNKIFKMVKNTMGGKKAKKMKNSGPVQKAIIYPDSEQYYAIVEKFYSHSNIDLYFVDIDEDGKEHLVLGLGIIRGSLIKRVKKVVSGDIFIVSKRDFETVKDKPRLDIIHVYKSLERNIIMSKIPGLLRSYLNSQSNNSKNTKNQNKEESNSDDDDDENLFTRTDEEKEEKRKQRYASGPKSNTITNDYLAGFDLPNSDDEFTTDGETDED